MRDRTNKNGAGFVCRVCCHVCRFVCVQAMANLKKIVKLCKVSTMGYIVICHALRDFAFSRRSPRVVSDVAAFNNCKRLLAELLNRIK